MQTQSPMAKDLMFKLRLDAQDRKRLDAVAAHFSAPAATAIRILIKEKYDSMQMAQLLREASAADAKAAKRAKRRGGAS